VCISLPCKGSQAKPANEETCSNLGFSDLPMPSVSHKCEPDSPEALSAPVGELSCGQEEVVVFETLSVPVVEVGKARPAPSFEPSRKALDVIQEENESCPGVAEHSGRIVGSSPASCFWSEGLQVTRRFQVVLLTRSG